MRHTYTLTVPENTLLIKELLFKLENPTKGNQYSLAKQANLVGNKLL